MTIQPPGFANEAGEMNITGLDSVVYFSAAWYFCRCAHESIETMKDDVVLEGDTDASTTLRQVLDSVMRLYDVTDIERLMVFVCGPCRQLAFRRSLIWNSRFQAWLSSGGRAYNEMSREPPKD